LDLAAKTFPYLHAIAFLSDADLPANVDVPIVVTGANCRHDVVLKILSILRSVSRRWSENSR
jgi:hypothetical protein